MSRPGPSHAPPRIILAGWLVVRHLIRWLASVVMPTEQELEEAGVYLGRKHE